MQSKFILKFLTLAFCFIFAQESFAQATGSLSGTVTDSTGAIVQGATVTVKNTATNQTRTVATNDDGRWTIPALTVGTYSVTYEKAGFSKSVDEAVEVEASVPRTIEASLQVGGTENIVTVTGDQQVTAIEIKSEAIDPDDPELLQDLVLAAVNEARRSADALQQEKMGGVTGGLGGALGGLGLPGF